MKIWIKSFILALISAILVRNFVVEPYYTNNNKLVFVNKLKFGGRFPITPVAFPFFKKEIPFTPINSYINWQIPYFRFFALSGITKKDKIVYNSIKEYSKPIDRRELNFNTCIATPGDTLKLTHNQFFVNTTKLFDFNEKRFRLWFSQNDSISAKKFNYKIKNLANYLGSYQITESDDNFSVAQNDTTIDLYPLFNNKFRYLEKKYLKTFSENQFIIPQKNSKIRLTSKNFSYLKPIISEHEGAFVEVRERKLFINGIVTNEFEFTQDYYAVLTEKNGLKSIELIPESHIVGVVN